MPQSQVIDAAKLVEEKQSPIPWLLEGVIPAGGLILLAGETSSGKSFLALELALGVTLGSASRGKAWGLPCALSGKVLYLCADADARELARRLRMLCGGYGVEAPKSLSIDFGRHVFDEDQTGQLGKIIQQEAIQLLIVDPLSRYLPWMNDSSMRSVGLGLQAMRDLSQKTGVTVIMLQGFNKTRERMPSKYGKPTSDGTERVRGSTELVAACDTTLLVTRGNTRNKIELVKNRQGRTPWASYFSIVDDLNPPRGEGRSDTSVDLVSRNGVRVFSALHLIFEKGSPPEVTPPATLAELVERRFKRVTRAEPERQFSRAELIQETEKRVGKVGKRALAQAFALLGKDKEIKVVMSAAHRKSYQLAQPAMALYSRVLEEGGQAAAIDIWSKSIVAGAAILDLDEKLEKRKESRKSSSEVDAFLKKMADSD